MRGKKQNAKKLFTSIQLSNRVPTDNFYRKLRAVLDLDWLYKATETYYGNEGKKSIDLLEAF